MRAVANSEKARAEQPGPLAEAEATKAVVVQETDVAQLEASRMEQRLQAETVKPAEAARDVRTPRLRRRRRVRLSCVPKQTPSG